MRSLLRNIGLFRLAAAFLRTRRLARQLRSRADIERWQSRRIDRWLRQTVAQAGFYRERPVAALQGLPVVDKATVMGAFEQFNHAGITREQGWQIIDGGAQPKGYVVGASTGTSGNRGLYVISDAERYEWLGVMLGKLLSGFPFERARIALILPLHTQLYGSANRTRRLTLEFFDLKLGIEALAPGVTAFDPDTIIAPPKVLRWLAERDLPLKPKRVYSGAEVLDPVDRSIIEQRFGLRLGEIYMASEGLLGTSCAHGTLHLAEDVMHFELQPVAGSNLVSPLISDFTRETQVMARYRMNDLLRLKDEACACGSPMTAIAEVVGRKDDIFELPRHDGGSMVTVTPDVLRNTILGADRNITDFRLVQVGAAELELLLPKTLPADTLLAAKTGLETLLQGIGASVSISASLRELDLPTVKLRRVERRWTAAG
jgi:putative adenylate-forming enzyme